MQSNVNVDIERMIKSKVSKNDADVMGQIIDALMPKLDELEYMNDQFGHVLVQATQMAKDNLDIQELNEHYGEVVKHFIKMRYALERML